MSTAEKTVQLPNGDLLRVGRPEESQRPDTMYTRQGDDTPANTRQEAIERAKADPNRPNVECPWCGQEFDHEEAFNGHVRSHHAEDIGIASEKAREVEVARLQRTKAEARYRKGGSSGDKAQG